MSPKIAVQIPAWNQSEELVECLKSLKEVPYGNLEVVVVNNGEDNTSEIVRCDFQWVTLIEEGIDLGFCKANNIPIASLINVTERRAWIVNVASQKMLPKSGNLFEFHLHDIV